MCQGFEISEQIIVMRIYLVQMRNEDGHIPKRPAYALFIIEDVRMRLGICFLHFVRLVIAV